MTWKNELPAGVEQVNGITVRRFPVAHERRPDDFGRRSVRVFDKTHSIADELAWLESEGPASPALRRLRRAGVATDSTSSSSSATATTTRGTSRAACPDKAVIVPTAERDRGDRRCRSSVRCSAASAR